MAEYIGTYWQGCGALQNEYNRLHKELVKPLGPAETDHGELLRVISNIYHELYNNGGIHNDYSQECKELYLWKTKITAKTGVSDQIRRFWNSIYNTSRSRQGLIKNLDKYRIELDEVVTAIVMIIQEGGTQ